MCELIDIQPEVSLTAEYSLTSHLYIKDIRISDHGNWRHLHWNALQSAYGESPFFDYYQDDIRPFFEKRWTFLLDFNEDIREKMCELIDIQPEVSLTAEYSLTSHL
ncbi:MAG: WbqC family protein [Prevotella sp.]|nr:WbqC family protein [Prevotella sp.]